MIFCDLCRNEIPDCGCANNTDDVDRWADKYLGDTLTGLSVSADALEEELAERRKQQAKIWHGLEERASYRDALTPAQAPRFLEDMEATNIGAMNCSKNI